MASKTTTATKPQRARTKARAGDATGRRDDELRELHAAELAQREQEMSVAAEQEMAAREGIVDLSGEAPLQSKSIIDDVLVVEEDDDTPLSDEELFQRLAEAGDEDRPTLLARIANRFGTYKRAAENDLIDQGVTIVDENTAIIRVNEDLENVTIGHGHNYDFMMGQRYRVPIHVAAHLEEKGFVYH